MDEYEKVMHYDALALLKEKLFTDVLSMDNLASSKKAIVLDNYGEKQKSYGFFLQNGLDRYFLPENNIDNLPIKVTKKREVDYKGDVFWFIDEAKSVKIPTTQKLTFNTLINQLCNFKHTNNTHFTLLKIVCITAYCSRINFRVIAQAGFGKDSVVDILNSFTGEIANIYSATYPKLEYNLRKKFLVFNEMGNLKDDDISNMQTFMLATGGFSNLYLKRSRKFEDTGEQIDIAKTSLGVFYNPPQYYIERNQRYFDVMFSPAVMNRFIPFLLDGVITTEFEKDIDVESVVNKNMDLYKDIISTLNYFRVNQDKVHDKYKKRYEFPKHLNRYQRSFYTILAFISEYAKNEAEYVELADSLYESMNNYRRQIIELDDQGRIIEGER